MLPTSRRATRLAAVAAVAAMALGACSSDSSSSDTDEVETSSATTSNASSVDVNGTIGLKFEPADLTVDAGEVTFNLTAEGVVHNIVIEGVNGDAPIVEADAGESASAAVALEAGTYTFYCNIAGHREAGMEGTLTVN